MASTEDGGEPTRTQDCPPSVLCMSTGQVPVEHGFVPSIHRSPAAPVTAAGVTRTCGCTVARMAAVVLVVVGRDDAVPVHRASMSEMAIITTAPSLGTAVMAHSGGRAERWRPRTRRRCPPWRRWRGIHLRGREVVEGL